MEYAPGREIVVADDDEAADDEGGMDAGRREFEARTAALPPGGMEA